jgi:hypothetical protein
MSGGQTLFVLLANAQVINTTTGSTVSHALPPRYPISRRGNENSAANAKSVVRSGVNCFLASINTATIPGKISP